MNEAATALPAFGIGALIGLFLVALTVAIEDFAERFNVANRRVNRLLADFDAANPQFNEDHPEWNRT